MPYWLMLKNINWSKVGYAVLILLLFWGIYRVGVTVNRFFEGIEKDRKELVEVKNLNQNLKNESDSKEQSNKQLQLALDAAARNADFLAKKKAEEAENEKKRAADYLAQLDEIKKGYDGDVCANTAIPAAVVRLHVKQWERSAARNQVR